MTEIKIETLDALTIKPGETLVLRVHHLMTAEEYDRITSLIEERLPDVRVLIMDGSFDLAKIEAP